jgi:translation initiation factor 1
MSVDLSRLCLGPEWKQSAPGCQLPPKKEKPTKPPTVPKSDGIVRVGRETKGRKGAGVTVISGIPLHPEGLEKLAKQFKQLCGTGGTVKNGVLEIQGEHRDTLVAELQKIGYTVKRCGG